jgi:hypothetical protein
LNSQGGTTPETRSYSPIFFSGNSIPPQSSINKEEKRVNLPVLAEGKRWIVFSECLLDERFHAKADDFFLAWFLILHENKIKLRAV